jgi:tRNA threonylcarbamoyladenosine biosynthesis protein TsaB
MIVLGIDTSTLTGSVAIVEDGIVIAETASTGGHGTDLLVMIDAVCVGAAIGAHDLDAVAIGAGPGSFTGLRIGMATAKGIAFAAKCPLWAVSSLAALAHSELLDDPARVVVGVLDARRGEVYAGAYRREGNRTLAVGEERVLPPSELAAFAPAGARFTGDALASYPDALAGLPRGPGRDNVWDRTPSAGAIAQLALEGARADVLVSGVPTYIRPSEAEIKYPDGVPGALRKR